MKIIHVFSIYSFIKLVWYHIELNTMKKQVYKKRGTIFHCGKVQDKIHFFVITWNFTFPRFLSEIILPWLKVKFPNFSLTLKDFFLTCSVANIPIDQREYAWYAKYLIKGMCTWSHADRHAKGAFLNYHLEKS